MPDYDDDKQHLEVIAIETHQVGAPSKSLGQTQPPV